MTLVDWTILSLILSIVGNLCCIWYIRKLLSKLLFVSQNLGDLVQLIEAYKLHLKTINDMELYYGDETIMFLIKHTQSLLLLLEEYEDVYEITDPIEFIETEQDEQEYDTEKTGEKTFRETDVFYGGSRGSNS
jgi:hypothetical protein